MIDAKDLKHYIIIPTLRQLDLYSKSAVNLLLGTAAVESNMGTYLHQRGGGPALGIYQIEPNTHESILEDYLKYRPHLIERLSQFAMPKASPEHNLIGNLYYATAIARIKYYWSREPLPMDGDVEGFAKMWRVVYNGRSPAQSDEEAITKFIEKYNQYVCNII